MCKSWSHRSNSFSLQNTSLGGKGILVCWHTATVTLRCAQGNVLTEPHISTNKSSLVNHVSPIYGTQLFNCDRVNTWLRFPILINSYSSTMHCLELVEIKDDLFNREVCLQALSNLQSPLQPINNLSCLNLWLLHKLKSPQQSRMCS